MHGAVFLTWKAATEVNNAYYVIERSADGSLFTQVSDKIASKAAVGAVYDFVDNNPLGGANYYRLKQTDKDGKETAMEHGSLLTQGFSLGY